MSNTCSKFKKFTQTTSFVGVSITPISSESDNEDELNRPVLSHIIGTELIYTIENENEQAKYIIEATK